jgi:hypothetical protein
VATKLTLLKLSELSLVDSPTNKQACVTIFKRAPDVDEPVHQPEGDANMADQDTEQDVLKSQLADLTKKLEVAELIAKMGDDEKDYMKAMDDKDRAAFMALAAEDRQAKMKVSKAAEETLVVDGTTVRKSLVGEGVFAVLKSQQAAIELQRAEITKAKDEAELATLTKRAADDFGHLVGTDAEKAAVLKAVAALPESVRNTAEAILTAAEELSKAAFKTEGHKNGTGRQNGTATDELETLTKAHMADHSVDYVTAYTAVISKRADLYDRALNEGN